MFCRRKTIRKVTMVVAVLMTNCHVSENLNTGPRIPQISTLRNANRNAHGVPRAVTKYLEQVLNVPREPNRFRLFASEPVGISYAAFDISASTAEA